MTVTHLHALLCSLSDHNVIDIRNSHKQFKFTIGLYCMVKFLVAHMDMKGSFQLE